MQASPSPPGELAERWSGWSAGDRRRVAAARKLALYGERHRHMVEGLIEERFAGEPKVAHAVKKFADRSPNLVRSVVSAVAVAYSRGCRRELVDLGDAATRAFAALLDEAGVDRLAPMINAAAWFTGPTLVCPHLDARGRLRLDVITPDSNDARHDGDEIESAIWRRQDGVWVELTDESWSYFDEDGELLHRAPHGAGACPAVVFRTDGNLSDWWSTDIHAGLCDAALTVAYKMALGLWTRQVSSNKLTVIYGNFEDIAPGQTVAHHGLPVYVGPKGTADVQVFDRSVSASDWLAECKAIITLAVSAYGLPPSSVTFENSSADWGTLAIAVRGEALGLLRNRQVPWLRAAERELWPLVCDVVRGGGHRLAGQLPPGDEVRDALRIYFPDIAQPAELKARIEALAAAVPFGLASPEDFLLASRPELTREEAVEEIRRNREQELARLDALAARNVAATPDRGLQSIAQLQGREGGLQSGALRQEQLP